jgi:hypothetical protein
MRLIVCISFFVCGISLSAQHVKQGEVYSYEKDFYPVCMPGFYKNACVLIRANSDKNESLIQDIRIEFFDTSSLKLTHTWSINGLFENRQLFYPEDIRIWNGQLCVFGSSFDKQNKSNTLYFSTIDSLGKIGKKTQLQASETNHFEINKKRFHIIGDSKQDILAVLSLIESDKSDIKILNLNVFDRNFLEIKKLSVQLPFQGENVEMEDILLDEYGNVHLLIKGNKLNDSLDVIYSVFAFPVMNDEVLEYQLTIPGKTVSSLKMSLDKVEKLLISGLMRDEFQKKNQVSSVFFLRINREKGSIETKGIHRIDNDFMSRFIGEERQFGLDEFSGYKTRGIFSNGEEGIQLIAEKISTEEVCDTDYRTGLELCHTQFMADKILIVSFNERAEIDWYQTINKEQESQDDGGINLSFLYLEGQSGARRFFFNELAQKNNKGSNKPYGTERSKVEEVILDGNGQITVQSILLERPIFPTMYFKPNNLIAYTIGQSNGKAVLIRMNTQ